MKFYSLLFIVLFLYSSLSFSCQNPEARGTVIVMYHRFDGKYPSTSVTAEMLERHIQFFKSQGFKIVPLRQVIHNIKNKKSAYQKSVAITVDDAFLSTYKIAQPIFKKYNVPYSLFINTKAVEENIKSYMSWKQIKEVADSGLASLEAHSHSHGHLIRSPFNPESRKRDVLKSIQLIQQKTGRSPEVFAYPYGETSQSFIRELKNYKWLIDDNSYRFKAAVTTQSGPAGCSSHLFAIPRFALNMNYGKLDGRFKDKMNSWHLPVKNFSPDKNSLCSNNHTKTFTLNSFIPLSGLNCFVSAKPKISIEKTKEDKNRVKLHLSETFYKNPSAQDRRERINCTLANGKGEFFWFGKEFAILNCQKR